MARAVHAFTDYLIELRRWAEAHDRPAAGLVADVAVLVGRQQGWPVRAFEGLPGEPSSSPAPRPPAALIGPDLLGQVYESALSRRERRTRGAFFTPASVAARLVEIALRDSGCAGERDRLLVGDPAAGGGAFLLAAARHLLASEGGDPKALVSEQLWGIDADPAAVRVSRLTLAWWAWRASGGRSWPASAGARVAVGDALLEDALWPRPGGALVGNPPFQGQLGSETVRDRHVAARLVERYGPAAKGYVDTAALFLLAACRHGAPGTRVALIQPESVLVSAHAEPVRREVLERGRLAGLWLGGLGVFAADVRVCAPVIDVGQPQRRTVATWAGPALAPQPDVVLDGPSLRDAPTWGPVAAPARGLPRVRPRTYGVIGDVASATAGFRDEYYGLVPYVREAGAGEHGSREAPLVTAGLIAPAVNHWGRRPARFARRAWAAPVVDVVALRAGPASVLGRWVSARLRPKLLVGAQAAVLSAAPDAAGVALPSVPVISLEPSDPNDLWRLLAVLVSPMATSWALERYGGAGLAASSVKLAARQLLDVPLPARRGPWDEAADACAMASGASNDADWRASLLSAADHIAEAYCLGSVDARLLTEWWAARLPAWPAATQPSPKFWSSRVITPSGGRCTRHEGRTERHTDHRPFNPLDGHLGSHPDESG